MTTLGSALASALALVGCGGSSSTPTSPAAVTAAVQSTGASTAVSTTQPASTSATKEKTPVLDLSLKSTVNLEPLPARYTCDGANISPPVSWSKIPAHTAEVDLIIANTQPVRQKPFIDWALAGIKPSLRVLPAGLIPQGAILGRNSFGQTRYSICPPKGPSETYVILLLALPHKFPHKPGFNAQALTERLLHTTASEGELSLTYKRR